MVKRPGVVLIALLSAVFAATFSGAQDPQDARTLRRSFLSPPDDCRPMMRWWWFGPAVTKTGLDRELRLMKEAGIGGFEVQPVYALVPDDEAKGIRNLPFLSPDFLEALRFTAERARALGLRFDLTLGSGWPYGGPQVSLSDAAPRLRWERVKPASGTRTVSVPDMTSAESLVAAFAAGTRQELPDIRGQVLWLPEGVTIPEVWFFISGRTGQQVKRAAVGSEGYVVDHYSRPALERYLTNVADPMVAAVAANPPYAVFCDSLEVYGSDWPVDFLDEFRKRRGYDLKPRLPALVAQSEDSAPVRQDWGKTLTELLEERFFAPMRQWAKAHGTLFRIQGYGVPPATLSSNALADLAEGEGHQWNRLTASRWASSASHLYGRAVTSSETWTWLHSPSFRATPLDIKVEADRHFLQGINQLIGHGWPYTSEGTPYPGGRFYAAGVFNDTNPWWIVMPDLSRYLQRLSFLLREGKPVNDIAIYLPTSDAYGHFSPGRVNLLEGLGERIGPTVVEQVLTSGYGFDFIDDRALEQIGLAENGYRAVVLPGVEAIPQQTIRKLDAFAKGGGIVVATRQLPSHVPGAMATPAENDEVRDSARRLFQSPGRFVSDESRLGDALAALLPPDMSASPKVPGLGFAHRRVGSAEVYFVANTDNVQRRTEAAFRVEGLHPECWDPLTGNVLPVEVVKREPRALSIALDLEPYGSRVFVFSREPASIVKPAVSAPLPAIDLSAGWLVQFGGAASKMEKLRSWTDAEETRYFSGVVTYEKSFNLPEAYASAQARTQLSFGNVKPLADPQAGSRTPRLQALLDVPVREAAVVELNGKRVGSVWCPPYRIDVTGFLRPGENRLRILVGNLAINHMAGRAPADYRLLNLRYGVKFEPQDMDQVRPVPSGLLGPVTLANQSAAERN